MPASSNVDKRKRQPSLTIQETDSLVDVHSVAAEQTQQQQQPSSSPPLLTTTAARDIPGAFHQQPSRQQRRSQDESEAQLWRDWLRARSPCYRSLLPFYPFSTSPVASPLPVSGWLLASPKAKPLLWEDQPRDMFPTRDFGRVASTSEVR
jgi:hypothetical protein